MTDVYYVHISGKYWCGYTDGLPIIIDRSNGYINILKLPENDTDPREEQSLDDMRAIVYRLRTTVTEPLTYELKRRRTASNFMTAGAYMHYEMAQKFTEWLSIPLSIKVARIISDMLANGFIGSSGNEFSSDDDDEGDDRSVSTTSDAVESADDATEAAASAATAVCTPAAATENRDATTEVADATEASLNADDDDSEFSDMETTEHPLLKQIRDIDGVNMQGNHFSCSLPEEELITNIKTIFASTVPEK